MKRTHVFLSLLLAMSLFATIAAFAEGIVDTPTDAGGGPYRRVRTQPIGYRAVQCNFTVPTIFLPGDGIHQTHAKSSPAFYVGGGSTNGNVEIDAGINYEPIEKYGRPPGWTPIVRVSNGPNPGMVSANGWRSNATENANVTSYDLSWVAYNDGGDWKGYLLVQANGATTQPGINGRMDASGGDKIFNDNTGMFVKRVIAVSQGSGLSRGSYEEDGTYMRGCIVSGAQVATTTTPAINWQSWSSITGYVDQEYTGYSPGGKDRHIPGTTRNATGANYIVDFPNFTFQQRNSVFASRYDSERVDINLENHVRVTGRLITPTAR